MVHGRAAVSPGHGGYPQSHDRRTRDHDARRRFGSEDTTAADAARTRASEGIGALPGVPPTASTVRRRDRRNQRRGGRQGRDRTRVRPASSGNRTEDVTIGADDSAGKPHRPHRKDEVVVDACRPSSGSSRRHGQPGRHRPAACPTPRSARPRRCHHQRIPERVTTSSCCEGGAIVDPVPVGNDRSVMTGAVRPRIGSGASPARRRRKARTASSAGASRPPTSRWSLRKIYVSVRLEGSVRSRRSLPGDRLRWSWSTVRPARAPPGCGLSVAMCFVPTAPPEQARTRSSGRPRAALVQRTARLAWRRRTSAVRAASAGAETADGVLIEWANRGTLAARPSRCGAATRLHVRNGKVAERRLDVDPRPFLDA